jgi:hypothetical protein
VAEEGEAAVDDLDRRGLDRDHTPGCVEVLESHLVRTGGQPQAGDRETVGQGQPAVGAGD